jgi:hypothetical protein
MTEPHTLWISDEVADAIADGRGVVALESSLIAQGLPAPHNLETALAAEAAVRDEGSVPATIAIDAGRLLVGAPGALLERLADTQGGAAKAASRDLAPLLASGRLASTTVSASMRVAAMAGIRLLATGGIGGVHRGAATSLDVSGDLDELAATRVAVVCSGAKSILDLPATLELLETKRVPVVGFGVDQLPAFYSVSSGLARGGGARHRNPFRAARLRRDPPGPAAAIGRRHRVGRGRRLDRGRHRGGRRTGNPRRRGDPVRPRPGGRAVRGPDPARQHRSHPQQRPDRRTDRARLCWRTESGCRIAPRA